jgi:hypothetical protein
MRRGARAVGAVENDALEGGRLRVVPPMRGDVDPARRLKRFQHPLDGRVPIKDWLGTKELRDGPRLGRGFRQAVPSILPIGKRHAERRDFGARVRSPARCDRGVDGAAVANYHGPKVLCPLFNPTPLQLSTFWE